MSLTLLASLALLIGFGLFPLVVKVGVDLVNKRSQQVKTEAVRQDSKVRVQT